MATIDDAFAGAATANGEDAAANVLAAIMAQGQTVPSAELSTAAVEPMLVIRRVDMQRSRNLLTFDYDGTTQPATD